MKIILWISIILTAAILFVLNPWNNLPLNYSLIVFVILGGPVAGTVLLFRWIDEKAAKRQLCIPESKGINILEGFFARNSSSSSSLHNKRKHYCDPTRQ
jgi:hypothetical protein